MEIFYCLLSIWHLGLGSKLREGTMLRHPQRKKLTRDTQITYTDLDIFVYREGIQRYPRHLRKIRRGKSLGWGQYLLSSDITSCLGAAIP